MEQMEYASLGLVWDESLLPAAMPTAVCVVIPYPVTIKQMLIIQSINTAQARACEQPRIQAVLKF